MAPADDMAASVGVASLAVRDGPAALFARCVFVLAVFAAAGCSQADTGAVKDDACGPIRRQQAQPNSVVHVLPGGGEPAYVSDPPTSGPHVAIPRGETVYHEPLSKPTQVGILERGDVLLQYRAADVDADGIATLETLAGPTVAIAPNPDLPDPVVASAWVYLRSCQRVDEAALRSFIEERQGKGPGGH
jgi:hypothetical protein